MIFHMQKFGDVVRAPVDSGMGATQRPFRMSDIPGGRVSGLETLYDFFIDAVTDPDGALRRDRRFREKLVMHPDVAACMNVREQSVVSMEDKIAPSPHAKDKDGARVVAEYANSVWQKIPNRDLLYQEMQQAILWGGVGLEWMWHQEADGTERPHDFVTIDKSRFIFDRQGNMALLTRETPVWGSYVKQMAENVGGEKRLLKQLPRGKFCYHIYERGWATWERPDLEGQLYFGRGEDENLFEVVTRDFAIWIQEMLWLEQYGRPPRILYVPPADWTSWASQIVQDLLTKQVVAIPHRPSPTGTGNQRMFEVDQPDVPRTGYDAFGESRRRNTQSIEKIMLMNAGVMSDAESAGGYSAHVSQVESGPTVMAKRDARRISTTLTFQLIPSIIRMGPSEIANCPPEDLPILSLKSNRDDEPAEIVKLFGEASQLAPVSREEFYERTGLRRPVLPEDMIYSGQMMDELMGLMADGQIAPEQAAEGELEEQGAGSNGNGDHRPRGNVVGKRLKQPVGRGGTSAAEE